MKKPRIIPMYVTKSVLLLVLLLPITFIAPTSELTGDGVAWIPFVPGAEPGTRSQVLPKSSDTMGLCVDSNFLGMYRTPISLNETTFDYLHVPGAGYVTDVGEPAVPKLTRFLEIPSNVSVSLEIIYVDAQILSGYNVAPFQEPMVALPNVTRPPFVWDELTYRTDDFYPYMDASVTGGELESSIIIRGHRIVDLSLYPVQFNPVTQQVRVCSKIEVRLNYDKPGQVGEIAESLKAQAFEDVFKSLILNYQDRVATPEKKEAGAEYLIITHDDFYQPAEDLAAWKEQKGLMTRVVNTTQINAAGPTANDIAAYIETAYDEWNPVPSYVLLVGDSEFVPPHYGMVHPALCSDLVTLWHGGAHIGTDLFHFTVDGTDYFPDIFYGRLSVDTVGEASTIINKIIDYERNPPVNADFYVNASACAFFEDNPPDGQEDLPFFSRAEEIRVFLETQGYSVERLYWDDNPAIPPSPASFYNGTNLPADLQHPGFPWNLGTANISNAIDNGRFLVYHIDHGDSENFRNYCHLQWGAYDGWHRPRYTTTHIPALANGDLLPVVISIDCNVGWFDGETDQTDDPNLINENNVGAQIECFSEIMTREPNAGAVAAIGSTRLSYVFANDALVRGFTDAIWSDYDPAFASGGLYSLGQILMYGKAYVANEYGYNARFTNTTFHLYHLFGDPEMEIWTDQPRELDVSHPTHIGSKGMQKFVINVTDHDTGVPVHHAKVCLKKGTDVHDVAYTDPSGGAYFAVYPSTGGEMNITVTKHNYIPYQDEITVSSDGATLTVNPEIGPSGINVEFKGSNFDGGEDVEIYLGGIEPDTTATEVSAGSFTHTDSLPTGAVGPLNVLAVGSASGRRAVALFRRLPDQPLPDPYLYCQWDSSTWHLNPDGGDPRWNNPDIQLFDAATGAQVASNDLRVGKTYTVRATIHNDAAVDATDTAVTFQWASWGAGQEEIDWNLISNSPVTVTVPRGGQADAEIEWTPSITGHTCIIATIYHPWDENLGNNKGQENTHVHPVLSPGEIAFTVGNPTENDALVYVEARQVGTQDLWPTHIERDYPQVQGPGENRTVTLAVEPPEDADEGQKRNFTVSCYIDGELIGGIEVEVVVKIGTTISCSASPSEVDQGGLVTVSGSISPVVQGVTVTLTYGKPDGTTSTRTAITGSDGSYSDSYQSDAIGSWNVTASWEGDSTHEGSFSPTETFTVNAPPSILCPVILVLILALIGIILLLVRRRGREARLLGLILIVIAIIIYYFVCLLR